jgi:GNAT superfamily N-acetyltransferase
MGSRPKLTVHPLTGPRWPDLAALFGPRGACGGCWCMAWRLRRAEFVKGKGAANKRKLRRLAHGNHPPGVLAYAGNEPVGWCAVAPRADYIALERSRVLAAVDDRPVWSISCLFVARAYRRQGVSVCLIRAAAEFARERGAEVVEAYPVEPYTADMPAVFAWTGLVEAYRKAGFKEVLRRSKARPIMRLELAAKRQPQARAKERTTRRNVGRT